MNLIIESFDIPAKEISKDLFKSRNPIPLNFLKYEEIFDLEGCFYINNALTRLKTDLIKYYAERIAEVMPDGRIKLTDKKKRTTEFYVKNDDKFVNEKFLIKKEKRFNGIANLEDKTETLPYLMAQDEDLYTFPSDDDDD